MKRHRLHPDALACLDCGAPLRQILKQGRGYVCAPRQVIVITPFRRASMIRFSQIEDPTDWTPAPEAA